MPAEPSLVRAELDRIGATYRKAGTRDYISIELGVDEVKLLGPPREQPRRTWLGPDRAGLALFALFVRGWLWLSFRFPLTMYFINLLLATLIRGGRR